MTFLALGFINAWRNLNRSALAALGMGMAAAVTVVALSLSAGYPGGAAYEYRRFVGGDVLIYASGHQVRETHLTGEKAPGSLVWRVLPRDPGTHLADFHPELFTVGTLMPAGSPPLMDPDAIARRALAEPAVRAVYPRYSLPALQETAAGAFKRELRGRNLELDRAVWRFERRVVAGRYFEPGDAGRPVALVDARAADVGLPAAAVGSTLRLLVPRVRYGPDGQPWFDYAAAEPVELEVIGLYTVPTRWRNLNTGHIYGGVAPAGTRGVRQYYWVTPQVLVPQETLLALFAAAGGRLPMPVAEVALVVHNLAFVENAVRRLQRLLPEHSVISTVRQARLANQAGRPERAEAGAELFQAGYAGPAFAVEVDFGPALVGLVFGIASLMMVANLLVVVHGRRREIAVLKAVGAKSREILTMVLVEALTVSLAGVVAGFLLVQWMVAVNILTSRPDLAAVGLTSARTLGWLVLLAVGFSLTFGLVPAWRAARLTVMEALRTR